MVSIYFHWSGLRSNSFGLVLLGLLVGWSLPTVAQEEQPAVERVESLQTVQEWLADGSIADAEAKAIEKFFRNRHGKKANLKRGDHWPVQVDLPEHGKLVGWFIEAPADANVKLVVNNGNKVVPLIPLADTNTHAVVLPLENHTAFEYNYVVNGKPVGGKRLKIDVWELSADSQKKPGVPEGQVIAKGELTSTKIYPGTVREWWVYVPSQYTPDKPACLMVFLDGKSYVKGNGAFPLVFDNLIHQQKIPPIIGVFVEPGHFPPAREGAEPRSNRSNEYDTCTAQYANFLEQEVLPLVTQEYKISTDPRDRGICGASSGGSGSFTAAWHRPDLFGKVVSHIGSFCDFRPIDAYPAYPEKNKLPTDQFGPWKTAHDYPALIRKTKPAKPLKIFLQDGTNDLDNQLGNWFLANEQMAAALTYSGYEYKFVTGAGTHSRNHGVALFPETLVWLWSDRVGDYWPTSATQTTSN